MSRVNGEVSTLEREMRGGQSNVKRRENIEAYHHGGFFIYSRAGDACNMQGPLCFSHVNKLG